MAQIEILKDSSVLKTFLCKLSLEEVNNKTEEEITKIAQNAEIKGFRKGHAPLKMIKEMYFAKAYNMAADHLINSTITKIAEENNLKLIASPSVKLNEEVKEHVEFEVTFELLPSIPENFNFSEVSVKTFEVDLQEEEVTKELNEIAKRNKVFTKKDGVSENGDIVVIDTTGRIDGVEFAGGKLENHQLELGSGSFIPGFEEQLIGLKAEETKLVEVSFPSDYHAKDLAGKPAQFFTIIKEVKKGETPELNDELAKKLSLESLEALKTHVTNRIKDFYKNAHKDKLKDEVFEKVSNLLSFEVSNVTVEKVMKNLAEEKKVEEAQIETLREEATRRLRLSFFLNFLASENKITVTDQDFTNFIIQSGSESGMNPFTMLEFYNKNKEAKKRLMIMLEEDKIFNFIFEKISVSSEVISKEKFDEILEIKR